MPTSNQSSVSSPEAKARKEEGARERRLEGRSNQSEGYGLAQANGRLGDGWIEN